MLGVKSEVVTTVPPPPGQPVDREKEIERFRRVLDQIRRSVATTPVLEWYGPPGIGKSTLIGLLAGECDSRAISWALVNFKTSSSENYVEDPTLLLDVIASELLERASRRADPAAYREEIAQFRSGSRPAQTIRAYFAMSPDERLYQRPAWLDLLRVVTTQFIELVRALGQQKGEPLLPVVLFFDETEQADFELADWIEEWVISPLVQLKHVVVVWTARRPWRWKRPEVRRRLESDSLGVFEQKDLQQQFRSSGAERRVVEALFEKVYSVTGGHPFANAVVIEEVRGWEDSGEMVDQDVFSQREKSLLWLIFDKFIRDYAFRSLDRDSPKPYERTACELMALVRLFDTTMLRRVLQACSGDLFAEWTQEDFGDLLLRLKKTQLLVWNRGYTLDPTLRHLVHQYYETCERLIYAEANRTALKVYEEWLKKPVDNRALFVIEALYHQACLNRAGDSVSLEQMLDDQLREYRERIKDPQALRDALERLAGEARG